MARTDTTTDQRAGASWTAGPGYVLQPVPRERRPVLDRLIGANRHFNVHALVEPDVTQAKRRIEDAGPGVSWTGFLIATMARAVAQHPDVNSRKAGNSILRFDRVDIGATVERRWEERTVLDVVVIPDADRTSCAEITQLLRSSKFGPGKPAPSARPDAAALRLPGPLRRTAFQVAGTRRLLPRPSGRQWESPRWVCSPAAGAGRFLLRP